MNNPLINSYWKIQNSGPWPATAVKVVECRDGWVRYILVSHRDVQIGIKSSMPEAEFRAVYEPCKLEDLVCDL